MRMQLLASLLTITFLGVDTLHADKDDRERRQHERSERRGESRQRQERPDKSDRRERNQQSAQIYPHPIQDRAAQIMQQGQKIDNRPRRDRSGYMRGRSQDSGERAKQERLFQPRQERREQLERIERQERRDRQDQRGRQEQRERELRERQERRDRGDRIRQEQRIELPRRERVEEFRQERIETKRPRRADMEALRRQAQQFRRERRRSEDSREIRQRTREIRESFGKIRERDRREAREASRYIRRHYPQYQTWFNPTFFRRYQYIPQYWREDVNWWRGAPWSRVNTWLGWGGAGIYPIYYYSGYPVQLDSSLSSYYVDETPTYPQMIQGDWLPLGVFALGPSLDEAASSYMFLQMAINRQGEISGTYYNASADQSFPLNGFVDSNTQQAYWQISGDDTTLEMATGLYNLTQDLTNVQLNFSGGIIQNWTLVRVSETTLL